MQLAGNDAITVDVLTHGLWKPLGTDGEVYYQFTADGKLLTVTVTDYTVTDGVALPAACLTARLTSAATAPLLCTAKTAS